MAIYADVINVVVSWNEYAKVNGTRALITESLSLNLSDVGSAIVDAADSGSFVVAVSDSSSFTIAITNTP